MAESDRDEEIESQGFAFSFGLAPEPPPLPRPRRLPRDWVDRDLTVTHKPDEGVIHFFDLGLDGRPERAVCPVCKISWEYHGGWEPGR